MRMTTRRPRASAGEPGKTGGYAEPKPDRKSGDDAEDAFKPDFEQGRETRRDRDDDSAAKPGQPKPAPAKTPSR